MVLECESEEKDAFAFWEEISGFKKSMSEKELLEFRQMRS